MGVRNKEGALYFATGIDNSGLRKDAEEAKRYLQNIAEFAKGVGATLGATFSAAALKRFADEVINVRSEIQMLESSFEVLLGSKQKADFLLAQIREYAIESPLSLSGVSDAAQMLLAFGVEAKDVMRTVKQLGDVSMGDSARFQSLTLAFSQMSSAGQVLSQDLRQMATAGFNPLGEIARTTGKSMKDVNEMMDNGQISVKQVADAFASATSEGGKFYGMTQKQAEGIKGLRAQLEGAWEENFNQLGENSESLITDMYKTGISVAENFETIGKILVNGIALFGSYKVALIAINTIMKEYTAINAMAAASNGVFNKSLAAQWLWTERLQRAKALLNKTIAANPYMMAAAALAVLGYGMYKLLTYQTKAEKQQKLLNESIEVERVKLDALIESFKRAEPGTERYKKIKDDINNGFGEHIGNLNLEIDALRTSKDAYKLLSDEIEKNTRAKLRNQFIDENNQELGKNIGGGYSSLRKRLTGDFGSERGKQIFSDIKSRIEDASLEDAASINQYIKTVFEESGKFANFAMSKYYQDVNSILSSKYQLQEVLSEADDIFGDSGKATERAAQDINKQVEETKTKISTLKKDLENLRSGKTSSTDYKSDIESKEKELKSANETLELLTGVSEKEGLKNLKNNTDIARGVIEIELNLNKERISMLKDGREKRLKESEQEWKAQKAALEKEYADRVAKYKELDQQMPESEKNLFEGRYQAADDSRSTRDKTINEQYDKEYAERIKDVTKVFLSEEEKKRDAIRQRYEDERKWAKLQLESGSISREQHDTFVLKVDEAEIKDQRDRLLSGLNDFKAQEKAINDEWNDKIAEATEAGDTQLLSRLTAGKEKAMQALNAQMLTQSEDWKALFSDLDNLSFSAIDTLINNIEERMKSADLKLDPADLKAILDQLDTAKQKMVDESPFQAMGKAIKRIFTQSSNEAHKSAEEIKRDWNNLAKATSESFDFINDAVNSASVLGDVLGESGQAAISALQGVMMAAIAMATAIKSAEKGSVILAAISAALAVVNALFTIFNKDKKKEEKIKGLQQNVDALTKAYRNLGDEIERAYGTDKAELLEQQNKVLEQQNKEIAKQIEAERSKKKTDDEKIRDWLDKIDDNNRQIAENRRYNTVDAIFGDDIKAAIDDFSQAYADMWAAGDDKAKSRKDFVREMIRGMILEAMRSDISKPMETIRKKMESFWSDGKISEQEENIIERMVEDLQNDLEKKYAWADKYLKDEIEASGVTGELKAQMTEQTGSQLVGLWNMTAMDIRSIKELFERYGTHDVAKDLNSLLNELQAVRDNTGRTAENTVYLEEGIRKLEELLDEIKKNTKPNNSRI